MRIGINGSSLLARPDLGTITTDIVTAEAEGFASYWLAQTGLAADGPFLVEALI